mgnify:CR=1 FL=1
MTALHLRGVTLPDGEHRDLWINEGLISFDPVPGATTVFDGGYLLPGLVDAHCHVGVGPDGPVELVRRSHRRRPTGTRALC